MNTARSGRIIALVVAVAAFGVYWLTLARTITWLHSGADGGDLVTAAFVMGIPHPPGYPLYTLIASAFARLPGMEPAQGVAIFSALVASAAVYVLARGGAALLKPTNVPDVAKVFVPALAALAFGFAPLTWSQAVIPEVYALNLLLVALILWACMSDTSWRVYVAALALGLGLAHHLSILLLVPGAWIALRPNAKDWKAIFLVLAPLVLYAYMPVAALANPAVKWGDPSNPEGLLWIVTAALYRPYLFALDAADVMSRVAFSARELLDQFTIVGIALAIWGALQMALSQRRMLIATLVMFAPIVAYAILYASRDSFLYLLPAFAVALLWMVYGAGNVVTWAGNDRLLQVAAVVLLAVIPAYNLFTNYAPMDVSRDRAAFVYGEQNLVGLPVDGVLFADGDEALFSVWYYRHAIAYAGARSVIVSQGLLQYDWYYDTLRRTMSEVQFQEPTAVTDAHTRAREIIRVAFAEGRAVCFTDSSPLLPEFEYEERGILKCVYSEK